MRMNGPDDFDEDMPEWKLEGYSSEAQWRRAMLEMMYPNGLDEEEEEDLLYDESDD